MNFQELLKTTFLRPFEAMEMIKALGLDLRRVISIAVLGILAVTVTTFLWSLAHPIEIIPGVQLADVASPFRVVLPMAIVTAVLALFITVGGRILGGQGDFVTSLALISWLQIFQSIVRLGALVLSGLSLEIALILMNIMGLYEIWIIVQFQKSAQGFDNGWRAFGSLVLTFFAVVMTVSVLIAPFLNIPA